MLSRQRRHHDAAGEVDVVVMEARIPVLACPIVVGRAAIEAGGTVIDASRAVIDAIVALGVRAERRERAAESHGENEERRGPRRGS
jgi:hypothetical protein